MCITSSISFKGSFLFAIVKITHLYLNPPVKFNFHLVLNKTHYNTNSSCSSYPTWALILQLNYPSLLSNPNVCYNKSNQTRKSQVIQGYGRFGTHICLKEVQQKLHKVVSRPISVEQKEWKVRWTPHCVFSLGKLWVNRKERHTTANAQTF